MADGQPYALGPQSTRELIIMSYDKDKEVHVQTPFSDPGGSGSFVVDSFGVICGLMYGEHTGLCGTRYDCGAGLVTSMSDVNASVARNTTLKDTKGKEVAGKLILQSRK